MKKLLALSALLLLGSCNPIFAQSAPTELPGCQYQTAPPTLADKQTTVLRCTSAGELAISGTINATSAATATAAAPSYVEGTSNPLSQNLTGDQRVIAKQSGTWNVGTVTTVTSITNPVTVTDGAGALNVIVDSGTVTAVTSITNPVSVNPGTAASWGIAATAAAPPANAIYNGGNGSGATGGLLQGLKICDLHAKYDASDTGSITLVTGVSGRKVYICGYILATGGTATNLKLREGSDANCVTNAADLTPAYQLVANDKIGISSSFWNGLAVSTNAYFVCINASAANAHQGEIWYTIQ